MRGGFVPIAEPQLDIPLGTVRMIGLVSNK